MYFKGKTDRLRVLYVLEHMMEMVPGQTDTRYFSFNFHSVCLDWEHFDHVVKNV